jgi:hypothetical protein
MIDEMKNYNAQMNKINLRWGYENKNKRRIDLFLNVKNKIKFGKAKWEKRKIVFV